MSARVRAADSLKDFVESGEWPHAILKPDAPIHVHYSQEIAAALAKAIQDLGISLREAARMTHVDRATITRTIEGDTVADIATLAMLEQGLHVSLWPPFSSR